MSYHIKYNGELFISDKDTLVQAIKEFKKHREKTTKEPIIFFNIKIQKVNNES